MMKLRVRFAQTHGMGAWTPEPCALPACLADARKLALARQLAEADTAETELAIDGVGTPTTLRFCLRVENFGSRFALTIIDVLATNPPS